MANKEEIEDEVDWDEWLAMSEAQREAALQNELKDYYTWLDSMDMKQYYKYKRGFVLHTIRGWRHILKTMDIEFVRERLKISQRRLVALRQFRVTGYMTLESLQ